jgi:hypothetical protein
MLCNTRCRVNQFYWRCTAHSRFIHEGYKSRSSQSVRFPYGISNFEELRLDPSYFYVDNTAIIHQLDVTPQHIIINRPAGWGKSLLLSMLECYYCKSFTEEHFQRLFCRLHIGASPSASRGSYFVLKLDLSFGADYSPDCEIRDVLRQSVLESIQLFNARYEFDEPPPSHIPDTMLGLHQVAKRVLERKGKLLILIDEYDWLANKLMFENPAANNKIVLRSGNQNPVPSPIRGLFEAVKKLGAIIKCRSIVTGITPIALADSCGGNIWTNVSLDRDFGDFFGFSDQDIRRALSLIDLKGEELENLLELMVKYYNGHQFPGSTLSFFNPTLCLYFLAKCLKNRAWLREGLWPEEEKVKGKVQMELMYDENFNVGDNVLALLCPSKATSIVVSQLLNKDNPVIVPYIHKTIRLRELTENLNSPVQQQNLIASLMFYHGIVSIRFDDALHDPPYKLCIPNELVRWRFLEFLKSDIELHESDVCACFSNPDAGSVQRLLQKIVDQKDTLKDNYYSEGALQSEIECALNTMQDYVGGLNVTAERNVGEGRYDLCISVDSLPPILLELKQIRPNAVDYRQLLANTNLFLPKAVKWKISQLNFARNLLAKITPEELRSLDIVFPDLYNGCVSVAQVENAAVVQCSEYLRQMPPGAVGFTVVQVGWTLLVKKVSASGSNPDASR